MHADSVNKGVGGIPFRPRIGIDARSLFVEGSMDRGIGQYTMFHLSALAKLRSGWEFVLLVEEPFPNAYVKELSEKPGFSVELIDNPTAPFDLYHIIDPLSILPGVDSAFRLFPGPFSAIAYDLIPYILKKYHFDYWPPINQIAYLSRLRQIAERKVRLLAISESTKRDFIDYANIPAESIEVIAAGLNAAPEKAPDDLEINETLHRLGVVEPFVLVVGGLDPHKNFPSTMNAVLGARRAVGHLQVVSVGGHSDPYKKSYAEALATQGTGHVIFPGFLSRQELTCLYKRAVCLSFPSMHEGFGFPVLEAMANGCPVICGNSSSFPEVCGDAALMFGSDNVDGISQGMIQLVRDSALRETLISKGLVQASKFSWELTARKTVHVWESMLSSSRQVPIAI